MVLSRLLLLLNVFCLFCSPLKRDAGRTRRFLDSPRGGGGSLVAHSDTVLSTRVICGALCDFSIPQRQCLLRVFAPRAVGALLLDEESRVHLNTLQHSTEGIGPTLQIEPVRSHCVQIIFSTYPSLDADKTVLPSLYQVPYVFLLHVARFPPLGHGGCIMIVKTQPVRTTISDLKQSFLS